MTEEEFINLTDSDFLILWDSFSKESELKTKNNTPIGFGEFLKLNYGLNVNNVISKLIENVKNKNYNVPY